VAVPEHIVTMQETLDLTAALHRSHPQRELILRLIRNTGIEKRHLVQPLAQTLAHPGFEERNKTYELHAKRLLPPVVNQALADAGLEPPDVDAIIYVSCTGFMMPSMTAWLINNLGFRAGTRQLPIAQLGCAAGVAAINRARDLSLAWQHDGSEGNVLVVSCEFCSLCYQPDDLGIGEILSGGLFGDAVAAAVIRGTPGSTPGISLHRNASYLIPDTEPWISYAVKATGFHFRLDRRVPGTMEPLAPAIRSLTGDQELGFYLVHAGGPRILDDLGKFLDVPADAFRHSRAALAEHGNIASAVVLDATRRLFDEGAAVDKARGLLAGFGPGITAELTLAAWEDSSCSR
jgi:1,3,6,8-tetrahydroxynaphthalene synthase